MVKNHEQVTATGRKAFSNIVCSEPLVLVNFVTEWCGPCNMMKSVLEELKLFIGDKARILKVDIEKDRTLADQYDITDVPTYVLFRNGRIVWRHAGPVIPSRLREVIRENS